MSSLADVRPPLALSTLDGRYRGAVEALVDHLSEPALNRERVRVEVEWLLYLTEHEVVPGVGALSALEQASLRDIPANFGADEITALSYTLLMAPPQQ